MAAGHPDWLSFRVGWIRVEVAGVTLLGLNVTHELIEIIAVFKRF